jgi:hypothetical protein
VTGPRKRGLASSLREHRGLADRFSYPVAACLQDRRTRQVAQGTSIRGFYEGDPPLPGGDVRPVPGATDAFHLPGIWVQFSHLDIGYYERFAAPGFARRAAEGRDIWQR